jgi:rhodanese-related sulfurtransferase
MRGILAVLLLGVVLSVPNPSSAQPAPAASQPAFKRLTPDELKTLLRSRGKPKLYLLDVREPKELEEDGALAGAVNIPLGTLEKRLGEVPKGVKLVSICRRGHRAAHAAELLQRHGYQGVKTFAMEDWKAKGYPLTYPKVVGKEAGKK